MVSPRVSVSCVLPSAVMSSETGPSFYLSPLTCWHPVACFLNWIFLIPGPFFVCVLVQHFLFAGPSNGGDEIAGARHSSPGESVLETGFRTPHRNSTPVFLHIGTVEPTNSLSLNTGNVALMSWLCNICLMSFGGGDSCSNECRWKNDGAFSRPTVSQIYHHHFYHQLH
jgi:hypothetical protein